MWRMTKSMTECARSAVMLYNRRRNIEYVDILQGVAQGCTLSPNLFKMCIYIFIYICRVPLRDVGNGKSRGRPNTKRESQVTLV